MIRDKNYIETTVHHSPLIITSTSTDIQWKMGTLRTLVRRAYDICLKNEHLESELNHVKKVFYEQNQYRF